MGSVSGKHRSPHGSAPRRGIAATVTLAIVFGVAAAGWYGYQHYFKSGSCRSATHLRIASAPEIKPALSHVAAQWNGAQTKVGGTCVTVDVTSATPAGVASAIAAAHQAAVTGLSQPNGDVEVPDVWVPDSSIWLSRLAGGSTPVKLTGESVASSPVVLAVPEPVAKSLAGGSSGQLTWSALLGKLTSGSLRTGIVDPDVDAAGLSALLAVSGASQSGAKTASEQATAQAATVGAIRALSSGSSLVRADLLGRFPRATDATSLARGLSVAPLPEQAVLAYNSARPPVGLVGLYVDPAPAALDYPYTPIGLTGVKAEAASKFQARLGGPAWTSTLASVDLRAADGTYGAGMPTTPNMPVGPLKPSDPPPAAAVDQALSVWSAVTVPGRMLAVIDVSGSMAARVPSAGNATREQVTVSAAKGGLGLFDDAWKIGLWTFSTKLNGSKPYRQLVPIGRLAGNRSAMTQALGTVKPIPNGQTGLYDTVLAAYQAVQKGWDPSRVNSVVIMTDGQNQNPGGLTLDQLLGKIKAIKDPNKPVEVIAIGIGNEVDKAELEKITAATGGGAFVTADPAQIGEIFLKAIALRPGAAK